MTLVVGDPGGSTVDRIQRGSQAGLLTAGEAEDLVGAFEQMFELRFDQEFAALQTGRLAGSYVAPGSLDPLQRRYLHDSLHAVSRIQTAVHKAWASGGATL